MGSRESERSRSRERLVFLDFDGVLNTYTSIAEAVATGEPYALDRRCIALLNRIIEATGARVVVSSTWRESFTVDELQGILTKRGFRGELIGRTPSLIRVCRGDEIQAWLDEHAPRAVFVILDDSEDMGALKPYLVRSSLESGLTAELASRAIAALDV